MQNRDVVKPLFFRPKIHLVKGVADLFANITAAIHFRGIYESFMNLHIRVF